LVFDLLNCVCCISDIAEFFYLRRVNFLVFGRYEHAGYSHELIVFAFNLLGFAEPVDQIDSDVQSFWLETVLHMNAHEPVYEYSPHFL
jgi:hypothetical protein